jgi:hypothetical protein
MHNDDLQALFGAAVLNGVVLVNSINQLRKEGQSVRDAVVNEIAVAMANVGTNVQQMLAPFQETISVAAGMAKMVNDFQVTIHQTMERWLAEQQLSWVRMAEMMAIAMDGFERYRNQEEPEACKILCDAGWLEMDRHFSLQHLPEMVVLYKARGESAMNAAIACQR